METVEYKRSLQWVGNMQCSQCSGLTPAWQSSGMSMCFPHFYCNRCSNVIHREKDQSRVMRGELTRELLDEIASTLPDCDCGGHFEPGANPKCRHCGAMFAHQNDPVGRLTDPHMIVVDGACVFSDLRRPYRVKIVDG